MGCQCMEKKEGESEIKKESEMDGEEVNGADIIDKIQGEGTAEGVEGVEGEEAQFQQNMEVEGGGMNFNAGEDDNLKNAANFDERNSRRNKKYEEYPTKMCELINQIRENPSIYAQKIEEAMTKIEKIDNNDPENPKYIYKDKVKVALTRGQPAFEEAADFLRMQESLPPLEFKPELKIPLPENEDEIHDPMYLKKQVKFMRDNNINVDIFFKDLIKRAEVSALLMAVDDGGKNPGRKRNAILNKDFKFIGINSKFVGNTFVAYFAFSK